MGERGATREPATPDDIAAMADLAREAHRRRRARLHDVAHAQPPQQPRRAHADAHRGGRRADRHRRGARLDRAGRAPDRQRLHRPRRRVRELRPMAARSGRPISISVAQSPLRPDDWQRAARPHGRRHRGGRDDARQVGARAVGLLLGFEATLNPFMLAPAWDELRDLPAAERTARLRRDDVRRALIDHMAVDREGSLIGSRLIGKFDLMFRLGDPPDYEPDPSSLGRRGGRARRADGGRRGLRPHARERRTGPALPADAELHRRHARRRRRATHPPRFGRRAVRRRRPRRHDLRRRASRHVVAVVGPRPTDRPAPCRAARAQADPRHRRDGRTARPRAGGARVPGGPERDRLRPPRPARPRRSITTFPPADAGCSSAPTATGTRSSPGPRSDDGESTGATPGRLVRGARPDPS